MLITFFVLVKKCEKIVKHSKNYSDGEFVKNCLIVVAECLCPEKKKDFDNLVCREEQ